MTGDRAHSGALGIVALVALVAAAAAQVGCSAPGEENARPRTLGGERPVTLQVPPVLEEGRRYPLVLVLHGYGANGFGQQAYLGFGATVNRGDAFVLAPDGTVDASGKQFWNADGTCCDFGGLAPDDVAYLGGLVEEAVAQWPIDPAAIAAVGHSNGGFMAYRLACERADLFASVVVLAGAQVDTPCAPTRPVDVLHVHGTLDAVIPYSVAAPSAAAWQALNGCATTRTPGAAVDLDHGIVGSETRTEAATGCPEEGAVELWSITGGSHLPTVTGLFEPAVWPWLAAHTRR